MFTRKHRVGKHTYTEVLESYRDADSGRPRHRCIVRWPAERSFAEEIVHAQGVLAGATYRTAYYQSIVDDPRLARSWREHRAAPGLLKECTSQLAKATAHHAALEAARAAGLVVDDDELRRVREALEARRAPNSAILQPPSPQAALVARLRALMTENDPDVVRDGLRQLADALDRAASA